MRRSVTVRMTPSLLGTVDAAGASFISSPSRELGRARSWDGRSAPSVRAGSGAAPVASSRRSPVPRRAPRREAAAFGEFTRSGGRPPIAVSRPSRMPSPRAAAGRRAAPPCTGARDCRRGRGRPPARRSGPHDGDVVGGLGDHAHVVGDDDHRHSVLPAQALEQVEDLRLDGHVERRGRLVGDQELRIARARSRSSRAGASRPRTGAGSRRAARRRPGCRPPRGARSHAGGRRPSACRSAARASP